MITIKEEGKRPIKLWLGSVNDVEAGALDQLRNVAKMPFVHHHGVAAMPDVHMGIGATVGSVIATKSAIIPAAVGVDIGCGMVAVRTTLAASDLPDSLTSLRH
jgi:tRNA-splicing ligase RtcB